METTDTGKSCDADGLKLSDEETAAVEYRQNERYHIMADAAVIV